MEPREVTYPFGAVEPGALREVAPGLRLFALAVPFPPGTQNAYLLDDEDEDGAPALTIVDPGYKQQKRVWEEALAGPLAGARIWRVIATHHHPDHIGMAGWFQERHGAELWTTRTAWLFARMLQQADWRDPPPELELFFRRAGFDDDAMAAWRKNAAINFSVTVAPMPLGFRRIVDGDRIAIGARRWRVVIGEGHASEHALLWSEEDGLLISGDQILPRISPNIGVYATEPDADPLGEWLQSCRELRALLPDKLLALPGHGDPFIGTHARLERMLVKHREALERLALHLADGEHRVVDCFPPLYRRVIGDAERGLATVETLSHLNRLIVEGRVRRRRADGAPDLYAALSQGTS